MPSNVVFENVSCTFRHRSGQLVEALRGVSLEAPEGQFICVVGRSGHGKTTLLRVLAGLQKPSGGRVAVDGRDVDGPGSDRAMVFQQDTVFPWMHVRDNVEFGLAAQGMGKTQRRQISDARLRDVGLEDFATSWPRELSGGMRKRVALAAVLAVESHVWLMDEPFGSLDYFTRRQLHDLLLEVWESANKTVFFVTHDIEEALILADRVLLLHEGRLVDDLAVSLPRPRDEDVRASAEAVALTKRILTHLGVTSGAPLQPVEAAQQ
jgi:NitT/TauT family transport system ATP-binding protein